MEHVVGEHDHEEVVDQHGHFNVERFPIFHNLRPDVNKHEINADEAKSGYW